MKKYFLIVLFFLNFISCGEENFSSDISKNVLNNPKIIKYGDLDFDINQIAENNNIQSYSIIEGLHKNINQFKIAEISDNIIEEFNLNYKDGFITCEYEYIRQNKNTANFSNKMKSATNHLIKNHQKKLESNPLIDFFLSFFEETVLDTIYIDLKKPRNFDFETDKFKIYLFDRGANSNKYELINDNGSDVFDIVENENGKHQLIINKKDLSNDILQIEYEVKKLEYDFNFSNTDIGFYFKENGNYHKLNDVEVNSNKIILNKNHFKKGRKIIVREYYNDNKNVIMNENGQLTQVNLNKDIKIIPKSINFIFQGKSICHDFIEYNDSKIYIDPNLCSINIYDNKEIYLQFKEIKGDIKNEFELEQKIDQLCKSIIYKISIGNEILNPNQYEINDNFIKIIDNDLLYENAISGIIDLNISNFCIKN